MGKDYQNSPYLIKRFTIKKYAKNLKVFIETGTHYGRTIWAFKNFFKQLYSIEINEDYYNYSTHLLRKYKNVKIIKGDSKDILPLLLKEINEPCLFWLDAHHEIETPIIDELKTIFNNFVKGSVILIDDLRFFVGKNGYPDILTLERMVYENLPEYDLIIENSLIAICPSNI
jgi:hypothetical protein